MPNGCRVPAGKTPRACRRPTRCRLATGTTLQQACHMNPRMRLAVWFVMLLACAGLLTGCVERRFVITTEPPGAIVYDERGMPTGAAPTDRTFVYYGDYQFTLVKDG